MLARLDIKLESDSQDISVMMSSCFHGALMKIIEPDYAAELHEARLHPYTQYLVERDDGWHWVVNALNSETATRLLEPLSATEDICIYSHNMRVKLVAKEYSEVTDSELDAMYDMRNPNKNLTVRFVTPTSFKRDGKYMHYPDIRQIYSSLIKKYSDAYDDPLPDMNILDELTESTSVAKYNLRSAGFRLEGVQIPSFVGYMSLRVNASDVVINMAHMLARFGTYSGIGIKTSIGMGAIEAEIG